MPTLDQIRARIQPAAKIHKKIKALFYGEQGTGKSLAALSFPRPLIIDTEGSYDLYFPGRQTHWGVVPHFDIIRTKNPQDLVDVVDLVKADNGATWDTLVIDVITVFWFVLQESGMNMATARAARYGKNTDDVSLTQKDWGWIKRRLYNAMTELVNLPVNVVLVAHAREITETQRDGRGNEFQSVVGVKPDAEKKTTYWPDVIFRMTVEVQKGGKAQHVAICEKDRSGLFNVGQKVSNLSFADLAPILATYDQGEEARQSSEDEAARKDAQTQEDRKALRERFAALATEGKPLGIAPPPVSKGMTNDELRKAISDFELAIVSAGGRSAPAEVLEGVAA